LLTKQEATEQVNRLYRILQYRGQEATEFKEFYQGNQPLAFASKEWKNFNSSRYKGFTDNWCEVVVNAASERIAVQGFKLPSSTSSRQSKREKSLYDSWLLNEQDSWSSQGFLDAMIARRSFALVWGDPAGEPIITWRDARQAIVWYDAETNRRRKYGMVIWDDLDANKEFVTLYDPDYVYKFSRARVFAGFTGLALPETVLSSLSFDGGWVMDEEASGVNHLGVVPLVEFPNRPVLGTGPLSEIQGVIPMQNAINLLWAYLFNAADYASMPARVIMGQAPPKIPIMDANGVKIGERDIDEEKLTQGRMLWLTGQNTTIGQFDSSKLDVFTDTIEKAVRHIAAQTRTPPQYLITNGGMSNLSESAIMAAEAGLVQKVTQAKDFFEPRVRDVFELIAIQKGDDKMAQEAKLGVVKWKDSESRSEAQRADAMVKDIQSGYPFEYLLEKQGHSPSEISRIMDMKAAETQRNMAAGIGDLLNASSIGNNATVDNGARPTGTAA
jgi:hypothetical protein